MSLHIKLSEEAEAQFRVQRRNSRIAAIFISGLFMILVFLVFGLIVLKSMPPEIVDIDVSYGPEKVISTDPETPKPKPVTSKPSPPANRPTM